MGSGRSRCNQSTGIAHAIVELRYEIRHLTTLRGGRRELGVPQAESNRHPATKLPGVIPVEFCVTPAAQRHPSMIGLLIISKGQVPVQQIGYCVAGFGAVPSDKGGRVAATAAA